MIGTRTKRNVRQEWKTTKNPHLKVAWRQAPLCADGVGTLYAHIALTKKRYVMAGVPRTIYLDLLHRKDAEVLLNQLLQIFVVTED